MAEHTRAASLFGLIYRRLERMDVAGEFLRVGTHFVSIVMVLAVVWGVSRFYFPMFGMQSGADEAGMAEVQGAALIQAQQAAPPSLPPLEQPVYSVDSAIQRQSVPHTTFPTRPRLEVMQYVVEPGDTLFSIAQKFALRPSTILWGNADVLRDDPHILHAGQQLNILPSDGTYYEWHTGDTLNGVAEFFGVEAQDIVAWRGNHLNAAEVGDFDSPNMEPGTKLFIPGGKREYVTWSMPFISRLEPSAAQVMGAGFCEKIDAGPAGTGSFIFPAANHYLSGYDYVPEANHYGIDIDGKLGEPVFAIDNGVVVYAGWNNWGYGNIIVIEHGNGWQSVYAHLDKINLGCGQAVYQGDVIGSVGNSGNANFPNLHFELMNNEYGRVNPWNFLP